MPTKEQEQLEITLHSLEEKINNVEQKKLKDHYVKLYQQGLFLKFVLIEIQNNINNLDVEYIKFENKNVLLYCKKVAHYIQA